jgi:hypothetical protein
MKKIILILSIVALASTSSFAKECKEKALGPATWPTTVKAAVADILSTMPDKDKEIVRKTKKEELVQFHHGWGTGIRNHYGLWRGNNKLIEDACGKDCHPDDASSVIIKAVWTALQPPKP